MQKRPSCAIQLSNGETLEGEVFGYPQKSSGELVFTTGMVGYSEALTDPSYLGQILVFTYPLIGNYGIPPLDFDLATGQLPRGYESGRVWVSGVIVALDSFDAFHWNSFQSIHDWLYKQKVTGIAGIDTRHLVHLIRNHAPLYGKIIPQKETHEIREISEGQKLWDEETFFEPSQKEVVNWVSVKKRTMIGKGDIRIAIVDCGVKWNIIRQLLQYNCEIELIPWNENLSQVDCHGWILSNGPGDPKKTGTLVKEIQKLLLQDRPILGICLGHQLLALASGAETRRMLYGHRSHNQPVIEAKTRRGYITSQNHGFEVDVSSLKANWDIWFYNANDKSVEGILHKEKPFMSVQFHPEAAGGPRDTSWIIEKFLAGIQTKNGDA